MSNSSSKNLAAVTVDYVRGTSRRFSTDLRDVGRSLSRDLRGMHRDMGHIGQRMRSSSLHSIPRIEITTMTVSSYHDVNHTDDEHDLILKTEDNENEMELWSSNPQLYYGDERDCSARSPRRLSVIRSPRTEEILKSVERALHKTDRALRDMLGMEAKTYSGMMTPKYCNRPLEHNRNVSAPPPSPSNLFVSTSN